MKRKFFSLLFLSLLIFPDVLISQSGWFWQNPLPQGNWLRSVKFVNENTGYTVGVGGTILKTTNEGLNWVILTQSENWKLNGIFFTNDLTGFVCGDTGIILKTTNAGINWMNQTTGTNFNLQQVYFTSYNTGFGVGHDDVNDDALILKTTNAGINWVSIFIDTTYQLYSIHFPSVNVGYSVGYNRYFQTHSKILKTTNGGQNWDTLSNILSVRFKTVYFTNETTGYACGLRYASGKIYKTTNGGVTWVEVYSITNVNKIDGLLFLNDSIGYVAKDYYTVLKTTNAGLTWSEYFFNASWNDIWSIHFINPLLGFAVGEGGEILRSTNGGVNWTKHTNGNDMWLWDVKFADVNTGFAVGENGKMYKTSNGGTNWDLIQFYIFDELTSISKVDVFNWYVGSFPEGKVFKTTNTGFTWDTLYTNLYGITRIDFVNAMTGFGICKYNYFFKTTNGGQNWGVDTVFVPGQNWALDFIDENTGYAGGNKSYKTTNGGNTWDSISFGFPFYSLDFQFLNYNTGFVVGIYDEYPPRGRVLKTTNAGLNWLVKYTADRYYYVEDIYFLNETLGFFLSSNKVYKTTDGGDNWFQIRTCSYNSHTSVYFPDSLNGYIVGSYLTIIKTTNGGGGPIGIQPIGNKIPSGFSLHQNYPNPFNPISKIKYEIAKLANVKIVIYDVLGREVATLVNEQLKPGVYEVEWNGTNYPSGVYFYQMRAGEYVETRKMVLIK